MKTITSIDFIQILRDYIVFDYDSGEDVRWEETGDASVTLRFSNDEGEIFEIEVNENSRISTNEKGNLIVSADNGVWELTVWKRVDLNEIL